MKKIMMLAMVAGLLVTGCATPGPQWTKPDFNAVEFEKDEYECEIQRSQFEQGRGGGNLGMNVAGWKMFERCMKIRGYQLKK